MQKSKSPRCQGTLRELEVIKSSHQAVKAGDLLYSLTSICFTLCFCNVKAIMVLKKLFALFSRPSANKRASTSGKSNRSSWTLLTEGAPTTSERGPSEEADERRPATTPSADKYVRLCPHETLSFKRAQRILSLYGQGYGQGDLYPTMDAFTSAPQLNHSELSGGEFGRRKNPRLCKQGSCFSGSFFPVRDPSLSHKTYSLEQTGVLHSSKVFRNLSLS